MNINVQREWVSSFLEFDFSVAYYLGTLVLVASRSLHATRSRRGKRLLQPSTKTSHDD
jgi:hypothetical protein